MPKQRKFVKNKENVSMYVKTPSKFRIGTRKAGKSAMLMSVDELWAALSNSNLKRHKNKVTNALRLRGVEV